MKFRFTTTSIVGLVLLWTSVCCYQASSLDHSQSLTDSTRAFTPLTPVHLEKNQDDESPEKLPPAEDLIKDWAKPDVALFITGRLHGYIEPCGCTGLANQKGGLMRRHAVMKVLQSRGWDLLPLDAGNQIRRYGQQPLIKLQKTYDTLCKTMGYQHVAFGLDDLKLGTIDLVQVMLNSQEDCNPFTCANMTIMDDDSMTNQFRVIEMNGRRIGVTSILGDESLEKLKNQSDLKFLNMQEGLRQVIPKMRAQKCDFLVLTAQTTMENSRLLAKQFPIFDLLVTTGGAGDPTNLPELIKSGNHTTRMIQVGVKGMYVGVVGLYVKNGKKEIKYKRVPLDERFKDSPEVIEIFKSYQAELKAIYDNDNADIKPREHKSGARFVGSEACSDCHLDEFQIWEDGTDGDHGPHAHATDSLINPNERGFVARNFDPECLSCHVTGWNPQNHYPYISGYKDVDKDQNLFGNGCENCHGPGSKHIQAEEDDDDEALMTRWRDAMRLTIAEAKRSACMECHDLDNSPDFLEDGAWDDYWPKIEH